MSETGAPEAGHRYYRALVEHALDVVTVLGADGTILFESPSVRQTLGYAPSELVGRNALELVHPDDRGPVEAAIRAVAEAPGNVEQVEFRFRHADGSWRTLAAIGRNLLGNPDVDGLIVNSRDVTALKRSEADLARSNRLLRMVRTCTAILVGETDEAALLGRICRQIVDDGRYRLAWVGLAEEDERQTIRPVAVEGPARGYVDTIDITWGDDPARQGPASGVLRTGHAVIVRSATDDPEFLAQAERATAFGLASLVVLPLNDGERTFGVFAVYSGVENAFDTEETSLLVELASDLAFGLTTIRARARHADARARELELERQTERALMQAIESISRAVETRDPYTAGHEREVSRLAQAIAAEIGLTDDECEGIRVAGLLHDIGKLQVPMEILARPTRLSDIEYAIVKTHVDKGYEILQGIDFPWPIAEMVRQHHERLDGTGYPQGLKGEAILPGARILAVADTVEAMGSHRPYRSSRGIDAALLHVLQFSGKLYCSTGVDACLRLFKERGYRLAVA